MSQTCLSEDLGRLEQTHQQRYAPHGLHLLRMCPLECGDQSHSLTQLYFRPVMVQQEDIMVILPADHPFYVLGKGGRRGFSMDLCDECEFEKFILNFER